MSPILLVVFAGLLGLAIGSFLTVVAHRVPRGQSIVRPGSRCPSCQAPVKARDNVPVLSWLLLRGRCRACRAPIAARYPLVELSTAVLFVLAAARLGDDPVLAAFLVVLAGLVAASAVDVDGGALPASVPGVTLVLATALVGLAAVFTGGEWGLLGRACVGAVVGAVLLRVTVRADLAMAGATGLVLGWLGSERFALALAVALVGAVTVGRSKGLGWAPFLAAGMAAALLLPWS